MHLRCTRTTTFYMVVIYNAYLKMIFLLTNKCFIQWRISKAFVSFNTEWNRRTRSDVIYNDVMITWWWAHMSCRVASHISYHESTWWARQLTLCDAAPLAPPPPADVMAPEASMKSVPSPAPTECSALLTDTWSINKITIISNMATLLPNKVQ